MGEMTAGKWVLSLTLYFFILYIVVLAVNNTFQPFGVSNVNQSGSDFQNKINPFNSDGFCDVPRLINSDTANRVIFSDASCQYISNGVPSNETCDRVEGCEWTNESTYLWFFTKDVPEYCAGKVNLSFYNNGTDLSFASPKRMCGLIALQNDSELCNLFSCTYTEYSELGGTSLNLGDKFSFSSAWDSVKFIVGYNVDLDMPREFQFIFSGLFFWLPFVGLLVSIYFALPFLH